MECELRREIKEYYKDGSSCKYYAVDFPYEQRLSDQNDYLGPFPKGNYMYVKEVFDTFEDAKEYITYLREISKDYNRRKDKIYKAANTVSKYNHGYEIEKSKYANEY